MAQKSFATSLTSTTESRILANYYGEISMSDEPISDAEFIKVFTKLAENLRRRTENGKKYEIARQEVATATPHSKIADNILPIPIPISQQPKMTKSEEPIPQEIINVYDKERIVQAKTILENHGMLPKTDKPKFPFPDY